MSNRTIVEFNHDFAHEIERDPSCCTTGKTTLDESSGDLYLGDIETARQ